MSYDIDAGNCAENGCVLPRTAFETVGSRGYSIGSRLFDPIDEYKNVNKSADE
jgi:hypothetical protein